MANSLCANISLINLSYVCDIVWHIPACWTSTPSRNESPIVQQRAQAVRWSQFEKQTGAVSGRLMGGDMLTAALFCEHPRVDSHGDVSFCAGNHGHGTTDRQNGAPFTSSATICNATEEKARYMHDSHAHMHTQKYIQLYVCLFVYLFTYLYLLLFIYLSDNSTIYIIIYLFCVIIYLFIHSFTYLFTYTHSE